MLKRLAILGVVGTVATVGLLACQTAPLSTPEQRITETNSSNSGPKQTDPQKTNTPSQATAATAQPTAPTDDGNSQQKRQNLEVQQKIEWFTGALAVVGALQGLLLFLTWKTIARQANLQEFLTRQWVDVANFGVSDEDPRETQYWDLPKRHEAPKRNETLRKSMELHSEFDVLNNTPNPLPLRKIITQISKGGKGLEWVKHEFSADIMLPPNRSLGDNAYSCSFSISLGEREVELYAATCFGFQIRIDVIFLNADGKEVVQQFHRWATGGIRGFAFHGDLRAVTNEKNKNKAE